MMTAKERYEWLWQEVQKPLPNYQDVIREGWIKAYQDVKEKPILDLTDESC